MYYVYNLLIYQSKIVLTSYLVVCRPSVSVVLQSTPHYYISDKFPDNNLNETREGHIKRNYTYKLS